LIKLKSIFLLNLDEDYIEEALPLPFCLQLGFIIIIQSHLSLSLLLSLNNFIHWWCAVHA
jgi:hypothetical protein